MSAHPCAFTMSLIFTMLPIFHSSQFSFLPCFLLLLIPRTTHITTLYDSHAAHLQNTVHVTILRTCMPDVFSLLSRLTIHRHVSCSSETCRRNLQTLQKVVCINSTPQCDQDNLIDLVCRRAEANDHMILFQPHAIATDT